MLIDNPKGGSPLIQDNFISYQGDNGIGFSETNDVEFTVKTDIRYGLNVRFTCYHFEDYKFIPALPYQITQSAVGKPISVVFVVPKGYNCSYHISGFTKKDLKHHELSVTETDASFLSALTQMHNHDGLTTPKIAADTVNIRDLYLGAVRVPSIIGLDASGNITFYNIPASIPGAFDLTAPIDGYEFDADGGGTLAFTWDAASGVVSYDILITDNTTKTTNYSGTGVSSGMTRNKSSFVNNHDYTWFVTAINAGGERASAAFNFSCIPASA